MLTEHIQENLRDTCTVQEANLTSFQQRQTSNVVYMLNYAFIIIACTSMLTCTCREVPLGVLLNNERKYDNPLWNTFTNMCQHTDPGSKFLEKQILSQLLWITSM